MNIVVRTIAIGRYNPKSTVMQFSEVQLIKMSSLCGYRGHIVYSVDSSKKTFSCTVKHSVF